MKQIISKNSLLTGGTVVAIVILGGGYWTLHNENLSLQGKIAELQKENENLQSSVASTTAELGNTKNENSSLSQSLQAEQNKNNVFESTIRDISGTVASLKKLSETDPNLLKKYSKVYFLSENYVPTSLSAVDAKYLYNKTKSELVHSAVLPYLTGLVETAKRDGVTLQIISAFRSFYEQQNVKTGYDVTYGVGTANQFSAGQGYSEHQLGTAVDFTSPESKGVFSAFEKSAAYPWLNANAYKFGFILSYPKNNVYYIFESWHWRFVGVSLATALHNRNEYFYNWSQSEIDKYLISIFD